MPGVPLTQRGHNSALLNTGAPGATDTFYTDLEICYIFRPDNSLGGCSVPHLGREFTIKTQKSREGQ